MKPLIGLSPSYYEHKEMDRSILGKSYTDSVQKAGGLPVLIPPIIKREDLATLIRKLDGIILTGGDDLHPKYYGESPDPLTPKPFHLRRGDHDKQIFEFVWENKVPTLAICLGMQEVNVFLGGSLYQDIPAQVNKPLVHRIGDWFEARHDVSLERGSLLHQLTGQTVVDTNSAHHQAIKEVPKSLHITGRSADGLIEVLEPQDTTIPLLAVQWHPESEINDIIGIDLFKWLVSIASK
ncbi:MAG: gamma-glutamyl-gamma-aminobutyrate hydrolase family protein [Candidatus Marinimicrobia bacterium]|jgi:putative glutamine amidotransferase|nr:gamma-glutamyl-gamma-aminobutyrate hydrolase family protein [Candidatus Neomarinimicrobiota bacterium]MBT3576891.1 gamma-glutamyl-gamma-aminobutyrate hydrolase family protein [Candidatus Neomarinimicrobiota bacterium]MBT3680208.1 gamma-glutamyl-gamma-aminobutyrate hydrolase family protein [Candidatus Neomarinimicrobiota bacterium]MBT3951932.1 gamma-glutamyl-gamma-aminobutyrate hydrolase family protein [Candidatus Neomarinimicrobiota bacterium]MBT4251813.1 gamma-glutamyl-gamma-aminobutyrate h